MVYIDGHHERDVYSVPDLCTRSRRRCSRALEPSPGAESDAETPVASREDASGPGID